MFKKKSAPKSFLENVDNAVHNLTEKAGQLLQDGTEAARPALKEAGDRLQKTADNVRPQLEDWAEQGLGKIEDGLEYGRSKAAEAQGLLVARGGERASDHAKTIAAGSKDAAKAIRNAETPKALDELIERVTGKKGQVKKFKKLAAKRADELAKASRKASKQAAKEARKAQGKRGMWIVWLLALTGVGLIGYYVWTKVKPVEDPWSEPLPGNRPADARPVGSHRTTTVVEDVPAPLNEDGEVIVEQDGRHVAEGDAAVVNDLIEEDEEQDKA
ncbi:hypothetical protein [Brevibacterium sp. HMSC24B04]|uniref:hypothetical protein n=1 Tax=Brevibacterium sp. HMSC24B04 TaxID=1581060 RepID=UPI0008A5803F|nr:hypothetical protein [Brevibacterium sp. HMSC24B04]OFT93219.1 hypothetical protein HMPREF3092_05810 [Brevibacterium sp. HMSC24B04]